MDRADEAGAVAAAGFFLELYGYVLATGDLADWQRIAAQDCEFCDNVVADVTAVYGTGGLYAGGEFAFGEPVHVAFDSVIDAHGIESSYATAPSTQYDSAGQTVRELPAEEGYLVLDVIFTEGGWLLQAGSARSDSVQQ